MDRWSLIQGGHLSRIHYVLLRPVVHQFENSSVVLVSTGNIIEIEVGDRVNRCQII